MIGQTISHYRILEKLGAGGMGVVYKAQDLRLDRAVALKFLPDNLLHDAIALERFRREVQAASALNHPGICTIYDAGEDGGKPFIAMEFIDGEELSQFVHGKPLGTEQILTLGIQLADALSVAHGQGIIHRDIKPANIYVTRRGQAKVLDFGLAKLLQKSGTIGAEPRDPANSTETSIVGVISGTPSYMSPEQIRGDDLDARTDVFSLGLLLYEMATGQKAFSGNTGGAVIEAILTRVPTSIRSVNADFPEDLEAVITKAISKDVTQRYQSAAELCADLQAVKRGLDTGHTVASLIRPAVKAADAQAAIAKYKWAAIGALGAAAVLLGLGAWLVTARKTHALEETDTIVVADFTNKTGDAVFDDTLRQGLSAGLQQSPFLNLLSEQKIEQTLQLMGKTPETKMTPEVARELCTRAGSKAYLSGAISNLGSQYVIGINAVNCQSGDSLARQQVTADSKEGVLKALDSATIKLRETLGESLKTIHKLDTPIEEATTPSLEALQAYSLGRKMMLGKADYAAAVPMFERAISAGPTFRDGVCVVRDLLQQFRRKESGGAEYGALLHAARTGERLGEILYRVALLPFCDWRSGKGAASVRIVGADLSAGWRAAAEFGFDLSIHGAVRQIADAHARGSSPGAVVGGTTFESGGELYAVESFWRCADGGGRCCCEETGVSGHAFRQLQFGIPAARCRGHGERRRLGG